MNKGKVFVRAVANNGKWESIDVLDLDDKSFRAWVVEMFVRLGCIIAVQPPLGEEIILKEGA